MSPHTIKKILQIFTCLLIVTIIQPIASPQLIHAATVSELEHELTRVLQGTCKSGYCRRSIPKIVLFQGGKLPMEHFLAHFHLIYDPQIDVIYFNVQEIDISSGGDLIGATYTARQIRESYLDGRLQNRGEKFMAYFLGEEAKKDHEAFRRLNGRGAPQRSQEAWHEHNAKAMIPSNNKVASYEMLALEPFQEVLDIDWKKYLPRCGMPAL